MRKHPKINIFKQPLLYIAFSMLLLNGCHIYGDNLAYFDILDPQKQTMENRKAAKNFWSRVRPMSTIPDSHYKLGLYYQQQNQYEKAIREFSKALQSDPRYCKAYNGIAMSYDGLRQCEPAHLSYDRALLCDPTQGYIYNNYACSKMICGDAEQGLLLFMKAKEFSAANRRIENNLQLAQSLAGDQISSSAESSLGKTDTLSVLAGDNVDRDQANDNETTVSDNSAIPFEWEEQYDTQVADYYPSTRDTKDIQHHLKTETHGAEPFSPPHLATSASRESTAPLPALSEVSPPPSSAQQRDSLIPPKSMIEAETAYILPVQPKEPIYQQPAAAVSYLERSGEAIPEPERDVKDIEQSTYLSTLPKVTPEFFAHTPKPMPADRVHKSRKVKLVSDLKKHRLFRKEDLTLIDDENGENSQDQSITTSIASRAQTPPVIAANPRKHRYQLSLDHVYPIRTRVRIEVFSGNGLTGMEYESAEFFRRIGYFVPRIENASGNEINDTVILYEENYLPVATELAAIIPGSQNLIRVKQIEDSVAGIRVILGRDLAAINFPTRFINLFKIGPADRTENGATVASTPDSFNSNSPQPPSPLQEMKPSDARI